MSDKDESAPSELRSAISGDAKRRRTGIVVGVVVAAVAVIVAGILIAVNLVNSGNVAAADPDEPLALRIATSEDTDFQEAIKEIAAEKGLEVEWVNVSDWVLPNTELAAGSVDGNAFQHILYLSNFNVQNDETLTPVFSTLITQWGIFSATLGAVDEIPEGGRIAVPDDPSNGGRALFILQAAGLLEIADGAGEFPTVDDITANPRSLELVPIAATTIPQQFDDPSLSAVVVGTSYFDPSQGIDSSDALFLDNSLDEENLPYVNVVASRDDNKDDPAWEILREAYRDARAATALAEESFDTTVLVDIPVETLRAKLVDLEELARQNQ